MPPHNLFVRFAIGRDSTPPHFWCNTKNFSLTKLT